MLALLAALQLAVPDTGAVPRVTLADALARSARLDPLYVQAVGQVDNMEWLRVAALTAFVVPTVNLSADIVRASSPVFNFGTATPLRKSSSATLTARLDLFTGGQKLASLQAARAQLETARATETQQRFLTAFFTESDYYAALAAEELTRAAQSRVRRAEEQISVARARVQSGAEVQTDTLRLFLEFVEARVALLRQQSSLRTARLQLGRRVGLDGAAQPVPLDSAVPRELPFALDDAVRRALAQGPEYRAARAQERAAQAVLWGRRASYLPRLSLTMTSAAFDSTFFPNLVDRTLFTLAVSIPIWDGGQREIAVSQARVNRDVARAFRADLERAARRDVTEAFDNFQNARSEFTLREQQLAMAQENFRVQDTRYRAGATTILDLVEAQLALASAEAEMVNARYATRLTLATLEVMLGQRLSAQDAQ
jgi:outer membrane protein TolC